MLPARIPARAPGTARAAVLVLILVLTALLPAGCAGTPSAGADRSDPDPARLSRIPRPTLEALTEDETVDGTTGGFTLRRIDEPDLGTPAPATLRAWGREDRGIGDRGAGSSSLLTADWDTTAAATETLGERRTRLFAELERYADRDEAELGAGDRIAKHHVLDQLIALELLAGEPDGDRLEILLGHLDDPYEAGRMHLLLVAALYESIDLAGRTDAILARLAPGGAGPGRFRISAPVPCLRVEGLGRYTPTEDEPFAPGSELRLYTEVFGIENRVAGERYRQDLEIEVTVLDADGRARGREVVEAGTRPTAAPVIDSFLNLHTDLPDDLPPGTATVRLRVTDRLSGAVDLRECRIRIAP